MNRRSQRWIGLLSALLAGLLVYGIYQFQLRQVELQKTVQVVAPKTFIPAGTMIRPEFLDTVTIFSAAFQQDMMQKIEDVAGSEALMPLGTSEPILSWKLDRMHLYPARNEATFQIPKSYILSLSNEIRAGDRAALFVSGPQAGSRRLLERPVTVASVKSADNKEIDDRMQTNLLSTMRNDREKMYVSRREANATIDSINLNLSEEEWLMIDNLCSNKTNKLVIAFDSYANIEPGGKRP